VEIQMPERPDVLHLEAPDLQALLSYCFFFAASRSCARAPLITPSSP